MQAVSLTRAARSLSKSIVALIALTLLSICNAVFPVCSAAIASGSTGLIEGIEKLPPSEIENRLPNAHPLNYYGYAGRLWSEAEKDKAVFWLYVGQLRFRFLLLSEPNTDPSGDPALFESLQSTIGQPITLYAGSDATRWAEQINAALRWDESNPNGFTSKSKYKKQWAEARGSLMKLRDYVVAHAVDLRKQRVQEGIGEVGVKNGVYVEEHKRRMPSDWPALEGTTPLDKIVGVYGGSPDLANALFSSDRPKVLRATTFRITREGSSSILVSAKGGDEELFRRTILVREENGAVVFEETFEPDYYSEGAIHDISYVRLNTAGDLVIQRESVAEGKYPNKPMPFRYVNTFWVRAARVGAQ
jgi:hypothetical protein